MAVKHWRTNLVLAFIILGAAAIISRLVFLQVLHYNYYQALAQQQQEFSRQTQGERGKIFIQDKNGQLYPLAINKDFSFCYVAPNEVRQKLETSQQLGQILNLEKDWILEKLRQGGFYKIIKKRLSEEEVKTLKSLNLDGVYLDTETLRYYPQHRLASHVVGFLGGNGKGQYGIEGYWDSVLRGKRGLIKGERGAYKDFSLLSQELVGGDQGSDLVLTIDYNVQFMAEELLEQAKKDYNIESGSVIVMVPQSGKILALANIPDFDPNQYFKQKKWEIFQDSAIQKLFEPGSVFKPITMAGALSEQKITPSTTYIDKGWVKIGGHIIYNYGRRVWGKASMTEVLEKSINTGAVFAERQLGHGLFLKYIERFGFFRTTGIGLQGEAYSNNSNLRQGREINFANASFGQGIAIVPIQLARAFSAIANGGKLVKPYIVERVVKENGKSIEHSSLNADAGVSRNVITQEVADKLTAMLVSVVENGFADRAKIPGYYVAGKTGTAQVAFKNKRGYYKDRTIQSFVGFVPAFEPKFLIMVKLDNPKSKTAEYSAAPLFRELAKNIIDYYQIPPDHEVR